jgi:hypothetical protein
MTIPSQPHRGIAGFALAAALLFWPPTVRQTLWQLRDYPVALVRRGEDWRGAVAWIDDRADRDDPVMVDAGLIEAHSWQSGQRPAATATQRIYLTYPVRGPYRLKQPAWPVRFPQTLVKHRTSRPSRASSRRFWIFRRPPERIDLAPERIDLAPLAPTRVVRFGGLTVAQQAGGDAPLGNGGGRRGANKR